MRFHIRGKVDRARMNEVAEMVSGYLEESGVNAWCGMNVYLTPMHPETNEPTDLVSEKTGEIIEAVTINNPNMPRQKVPGSARRRLTHAQRVRERLRLVNGN